MKRNRFYSVLMAIVMTLSIGMLASCGDDDNNNTPTTDPGATSCTLYLVESYLASNFDLADMSTSFTKSGDADSYVTFNKETLTDIDHISPEAVKEFVKSQKFYPSQKGESVYFRVTPIYVTNFPSTYTVKHNFTAKSSLAEDVTRNFGCFQSYITIDNKGRAISLKGAGNTATGIMLNKLPEFLNMTAKNYSAQISVSKNNGIISVSAY